jgi:hypothetical protein
MTRTKEPSLPELPEIPFDATMHPANTHGRQHQTFNAWVDDFNLAIAAWNEWMRAPLRWTMGGYTGRPYTGSPSGMVHEGAFLPIEPLDYIPPGGMCVTAPDGSYEWILPRSEAPSTELLNRMREQADQSRKDNT